MIYVLYRTIIISEGRDMDMPKHKKKEKQDNKTEATKWAAFAAWAVPAYPIAETIKIVVKHFLK